MELVCDGNTVDMQMMNQKRCLACERYDDEPKEMSCM